MTLVERLQQARARSRSSPIAITLLLAANAVPLFGVLFLRWDAVTLLLIFWLENLVVGIANIPKILLSGLGPSKRRVDRIGAIYSAIVFPLHYGLFWYLHGVFLLLLIDYRGIPWLDVPAVLGVALSEMPVVLAVLALVLSHGASLIFNYVGRREYLLTTHEHQLWRPYPRMVVLHISILLGAWLAMGLGEPMTLLIGLVVFKSAFDVVLHLREHGRLQGSPHDRALAARSA